MKEARHPKINRAPQVPVRLNAPGHTFHLKVNIKVSFGEVEEVDMEEALDQGTGEVQQART
eukprot:6327524-Karenia_brevis.AAC.1